MDLRGESVPSGVHYLVVFVLPQSRSLRAVNVLLLSTALLFLLMGCLTIIHAPNLFAWKVAVVAGEFGHFVALVPVLTGLIAMTRLPRDGVSGWLTIALSIGACLLFLRPACQARRIAADLPARMEAAFGPIRMNRPAFSPQALFRRRDQPIAVETRVFAHAGTPDELAFDFYRPPPESGPRRPCVIVIHGGGWDGGDRRQLPGFNHWLARRGYAVAAISYRLAPRFTWPAPRDDVRAAIDHLKLHAETLGIDPARLVLLGRSAGGQIASATGYTANDPAIRGVIAFYGPHDMVFAWRHSRESDMLDPLKLLRQYLGGTPETAADTYESASAILHVRRGSTPPTLLLHGTIDTLVWRRQSERLAQRLGEAGVDGLFLELPWATHAFDVNMNGPGGQLATFAVEWYLAAVTR